MECPYINKKKSPVYVIVCRAFDFCFWQRICVTIKPYLINKIKLHINIVRKFNNKKYFVDCNDLISTFKL